MGSKYRIYISHIFRRREDYKFVNLIFVVNVGCLYHDKRRGISLPSVGLLGFRQGLLPKIFNTYKICTDAVNSKITTRPSTKHDFRTVVKAAPVPLPPRKFVPPTSCHYQL